MPWDKIRSQKEWTELHWPPSPSRPTSFQLILQSGHILPHLKLEGGKFKTLNLAVPPTSTVFCLATLYHLVAHCTSWASSWDFPIAPQGVLNQFSLFSLSSFLLLSSLLLLIPQVQSKTSIPQKMTSWSMAKLREPISVTVTATLLINIDHIPSIPLQCSNSMKAGIASLWLPTLSPSLPSTIVNWERSHDRGLVRWCLQIPSPPALKFMTWWVNHQLHVYPST